MKRSLIALLIATSLLTCGACFKQKSPEPKPAPVDPVTEPATPNTDKEEEKSNTIVVSHYRPPAPPQPSESIAEPAPIKIDSPQPVPEDVEFIIGTAQTPPPSGAQMAGVRKLARSAPQVLSQLGYVGQPLANTESYSPIVSNDFRSVRTNPLSTFSIDIDTASYSNVRRFLSHGQLPPPGAVRVEEMINYFDYNYVEATADRPFGIDVEVAEAPWNQRHRLARIGLRGRDVSRRARPASNLVFLLDVSGSMGAPNKLPLVKRSMRMLVNELNSRDRVSIVVYAGAAGLVLEPTPASNRDAIFQAIENLQSGGSTAGGAGIQLAYRQARDSFIEGGVNRVILATDGDFNVGVSDRSSLVKMIKQEASTGVALTALGFGMGNYKDDTLEQLADNGDGQYAYIDTLNEAHKLFVEEAGGTLVTIAKDVKIQVEFNPAEVRSYRLIGYENRALRDEDFNDDKVDAGDIGAGHTVTALYEIVPRGLPQQRPGVDALKYQSDPTEDETPIDLDDSGELLTVKVRWKAPEGGASRRHELAVIDGGQTLAASSDDFRFAVAVASFGQLVTDSDHTREFGFQDVMALAENGIGRDLNGHRVAFLDLIRKAHQLKQVDERASR